MNLGMEGRVAVVAGSSRGIGRAIAESLLAEGCKVVITGRDDSSLRAAREAMEAATGGDRVQAFEGDLRDAAVVGTLRERVAASWGTVDIVVASVGSGSGSPGYKPEAAEWDALFATNLWSTVRLLDVLLPDMVAARRGSVVVVASITGLEASEAPLPYSAAKAALVAYAKNLSRRVGPQGVRINCVAPGNVLFPGGSWERHLSQRRGEVERYIATEVSLARFGTAQEIADVVAFLCSDRAAFLTGACVVADGGQTRRY